MCTLLFQLYILLFQLCTLLFQLCTLLFQLHTLLFQLHTLLFQLHCLLGQLIVASENFGIAMLDGRHKFLFDIDFPSHLHACGGLHQSAHNMLHIHVTFVEAVVDFQHLVVVFVLLCLVENAEQHIKAALSLPVCLVCLFQSSTQ